MRCTREARNIVALSAIAASVVGSGPALAYCPTAASARNGFVLVSEARGIRTEVQPSQDDMLTSNLIIGGKLQSTSTYYKGYLVTRIVYGSGTTSTPSYDFDYTKDPPFAEGYHKAFRMTLTQANGAATTLTVETTVVGHERISVGDCALDTLVIEGRTEFADASVQTRRGHFSPLLRTFVRATFTNSNAPSSTTVFDRIEPAGATR
jgi:hypothetical protein